MLIHLLFGFLLNRAPTEVLPLEDTPQKIKNMIWVANKSQGDYMYNENTATANTGWKNMSRYQRIWTRKIEELEENGRQNGQRHPLDNVARNIWHEIKRLGSECPHLMVAVDKNTKELYMKVERITQFSWTMNKRMYTNLLHKEMSEHAL